MHVFNNRSNLLTLKAIGHHLLKVNFIIFIAANILSPVEMEQCQ